MLFATPLLLTSILPLLALAAPAPVPTPIASPCDDSGSSSAERLQYLLLHIVGVVAAAVASATRVYYAPSAAIDFALTLLFYVAVLLLLAVALYVTYAFESPDMLLVCAAAGVVIAWRSVPRLWSVRARLLHWNAPMWRTRAGMIYRRVRRVLTKDDLEVEPYWNGRPSDSMLVDGEQIVELAEENPRHWEESVADWQDFVIRGRLGEQPARRAALALRMAYTVPLPALVPCGKGEYFAGRGALGVEVARVWKLEQKQMCNFEALKQSHGTQLTSCTTRTELSAVLHLKMLLYTPPPGEKGADWTSYATNWLFGEIVTSMHEPLPDALASLASGRIEPDGDKFWNLLARNDERLSEYMEALDRGGVG